MDTGNHIAPSAHVRTQLRRVAQKLNITAGVIYIQADALRHRTCEADEDLALVLQHAVVTALYEQTEHVRALLADLRVCLHQRHATTHNVPM